MARDFQRQALVSLGVAMLLSLLGIDVMDMACALAGGAWTYVLFTLPRKQLAHSCAATAVTSDSSPVQLQRCINATQRLQSTNAGCTMDQSSDSKTLFDLQVRVALLEQALASTPSLATPTTPSLLGILLAVELPWNKLTRLYAWSRANAAQRQSHVLATTPTPVERKASSLRDSGVHLAECPLVPELASP
ncbi:uncharacterized protein MONBRDRAFT_5445 [Monosiga brevicollis MX1]|uniref:Uncharacterized protein n=1 Tax=Monosiga brevicollis TaxID=81824 RepID=A9UR03_MONBE|nr:uncharacterized protein MONBRDRAFT_5445 [Monosiga brevicollis MX1]EDQ92690.1 predicted protein [Monosiga brevicollis MX1]|eukprot:XP_001742452.1 hypothetical protein [Monosiga brevicollis MX1]